MGQLPFTTTQVKQILDGRLHSPIQDEVGDNYTSASRLAVTAATPFLFESNGAVRSFSVFPDHVTSIWDTSTNIATFSELDNTPEMVANIQFTFDPSVAAAGNLTLMIYVNETVPILMKSYSVPYKATETRATILATFYAGDDTGFDVKNKGVYFEVEASDNGEYWDPAIEIYRT